MEGVWSWRFLLGAPTHRQATLHLPDLCSYKKGVFVQNGLFNDARLVQVPDDVTCSDGVNAIRTNTFYVFKEEDRVAFRYAKMGFFGHCRNGGWKGRGPNRGVFGRCAICVIMDRFALKDWFCLLHKGERYR